MKLIVDLNDIEDIRAAIEYLTGRLADPIPSAAPEATEPPEATEQAGGYDRKDVRRTLAGYGATRLPILCKIAMAAPGRLPKEEAYALARRSRPDHNPVKVVAGLRSSLERGWRGRTGRTDRFVTTYRDGFGMDPELARLVLEVVNELLPTMHSYVAEAVRQVLDEPSD